MYFGEIEGQPELEDGHPPGTRLSLQEDNQALREEIAALMDRLRRRPGTLSSTDLPFLSNRFHDSDSDDTTPEELGANPPRRDPEAVTFSGGTVVPSSQSSQTDASSQSPSKEGSSSTQRQSSRIRHLKGISHPRKEPLDAAPAAATRRRVRDRYFYEPVTQQISFPEGEVSGTNPKALITKDPNGEVSSTASFLSSGEVSGTNPKALITKDPNGEVSSTASFLSSEVSASNQSPGISAEPIVCPVVVDPLDSDGAPPSRGMVYLSQRTIRKVLAAKETLFKFGTFVPRNESEALRSPESARWIAGRDLEWLRMGQRETFERDWTWNRIQREFPSYLKADIGHLFYVFDYKYSGEHRVRLVFDGSRQSPSTYSETYAPAARQESVRLFHIVLVEEGYFLGQYDVPQAFLLSPIDNDIFVYPPSGQSEYPGQILKLRKALYGGKQSAYLWFTMINAFILELGFTASPMDSCLYKRDDAILILYCDDLRIGASSLVLKSLQEAFFVKFGITTAPGNRFLGMDTDYQRDQGYMKLSMKTYIESTVSRFENFDLS